MQDFAQKLEAVDRLELLTLVDNYVDVLLPGGLGFTRAGLARKGESELPRHTLIAEHGLSLLITVYRDGVSHTVLLDTGYNSATMLHNMDYLNVDPANIEAVVLSHGHMDHSGGLYPLLKQLGTDCRRGGAPGCVPAAVPSPTPVGQSELPVNMPT